VVYEFTNTEIKKRDDEHPRVYSRSLVIIYSPAKLKFMTYSSTN
jgi:hypothetical protein